MINIIIKTLKMPATKEEAQATKSQAWVLETVKEVQPLLVDNKAKCMSRG
jgi:hypothetical protein